MNENRHLTDYYYLNVIVIAIFKKNANLDEKKTTDQNQMRFPKQSTSATPIYITKKMTQREFMGHIIVVYIALGSGKYTTTT